MDVADLLRGTSIAISLSGRDVILLLFVAFAGDAALLEAAKKGNLSRVEKLASEENINCRDTQGRNSTPLHLAGAYTS